MALSFLSDMGNFAGAASPVASGIGNLIQLLGGGPKRYQDPVLDYGPTSAETQANSLFQALLDPNNSLVKQNTQDNLAQGAQQFLTQLRTAQLLDARRMGRGQRGTFFNPERADETVNYMVSRGLPGLQTQARDSAVNNIMTVANGLQGQAAAQNERRIQQNKDRQNIAARNQLSGGFGGQLGDITSGIQGFLKALGGTGQQIQSPSSDFIGAMPQQPGIIDTISGWF